MCEMHSVPGGKTNSLKASCMFFPPFFFPPLSFFEKWHKSQLRADSLAVRERLSGSPLTDLLSLLFLSLLWFFLAPAFVAAAGRLWRTIRPKARRRWRTPRPRWRRFPTRLPKRTATRVKRNFPVREQREEEGGWGLGRVVGCEGFLFFFSGWKKKGGGHSHWNLNAMSHTTRQKKTKKNQQKATEKKE